MSDYEIVNTNAESIDGWSVQKNDVSPAGPKISRKAEAVLKSVNREKDFPLESPIQSE